MSNTKNLKNAELIPLIPRPGKFWTLSTRIWLFRSFLKTRLCHCSSLIAFCQFLKTLLWKEIWTDRHHSMDHSPDKFFFWLNISEQEATLRSYKSYWIFFVQLRRLISSFYHLELALLISVHDVISEEVYNGGSKNKLDWSILILGKMAGSGVKEVEGNKKNPIKTQLFNQNTLFINIYIKNISVLTRLTTNTILKLHFYLIILWVNTLLHLTNIDYITQIQF